MTYQPLNLTGEELKVLLETGFLLREASRFEDAESVFRGCVELMPESEVPLVGLGTVFLQKGDYQKALDVCRKAVARNEASQYARLHLGEALLFNSRNDEARNELDRVIESAPETTYAETARRMLKTLDIV